MAGYILTHCCSFLKTSNLFSQEGCYLAVYNKNQVFGLFVLSGCDLFVVAFGLLSEGLGQILGARKEQMVKMKNSERLASARVSKALAALINLLFSD